MKRAPADRGPLRPHYDFRGGVRGKYASRYRAGTNAVVLDPDVAAAFPNAVAVNRALRMLEIGRGPRGPRRSRACQVDTDSPTIDRMKYLSRITIDPGVRSGKPRVRGTRLTVEDVLSYLASGMTEDEILADFPPLTRDDIRACLAFAAERERRILGIRAA